MEPLPPSIRVLCRPCGFVFDTWEEVHAHCQTMHQSVTYSCCLCGPPTTFQTKTRYDQHHLHKHSNAIDPSFAVENAPVHTLKLNFVISMDLQYLSLNV